MGKAGEDGSPIEAVVPNLSPLRNHTLLSLDFLLSVLTHKKR
jgi:hypothetical protein